MVVTIRHPLTSQREEQSRRGEKLWQDAYGNTTIGFTWYLFASDTKTGEPVFPYQLELDGPLYGIQYDLDNSSILGIELPYYDQIDHVMQDVKRVNVQWSPLLVRWEMDSGVMPMQRQLGVHWFKKDVIGRLPFMEAMLTQTISTIDSMNDIYFLCVPQVKFPYDEYNSFFNGVYGLDISKKAQVVLQEGFDPRFGVADIQV